MWHAKPEIGWQFKWISSGRHETPRFSSAPLYPPPKWIVYCTCLPTRKNLFPHEAPLFYERLKRLVPFQFATTRRPPVGRDPVVLRKPECARDTQKPMSIIFGHRLETEEIPGIAGHFVNLSPGLSWLRETRAKGASRERDWNRIVFSYQAVSNFFYICVSDVWHCSNWWADK